MAPSNEPPPTANSATPTPASKPFDIVRTYRDLLASDPELTMPVAAIEALVEALASNPSLSTISETLSLLSAHTATLKAAIPNPISLSAGTDLFQRYLITSLTRRPASGTTSGPNQQDSDFRMTRNHLLSNGRVFVARAKASRDKIASFGRHFVRDGATVLTNGGSRVVGALLQSAATGSDPAAYAGARTGARPGSARGRDRGSVRFRVIYALPDPGLEAKSRPGGNGGEEEREGQAIVARLRALGVPVATVPESAVAYAMGKVDMVLVGAEGVVESGGAISRLGTYQMGVLARAAGKPFYVVAESHKFVRLYPLGQYDLPIDQKVVRFMVGAPGAEVEVREEGLNRGVLIDEGVEMEGRATEVVEDVKSPKPADLDGGSNLQVTMGNGIEDAVDFTVCYLHNYHFRLHH